MGNIELVAEVGNPIPSVLGYNLIILAEKNTAHKVGENINYDLSAVAWKLLRGQNKVQEV